MLTIDASCPGGNILIEDISGDVIRLREDLRDTEGGWFFWRFRVRGAAGRDLRFFFTSWEVIGPRGPAISFDQGLTWNYLGLDRVYANQSFRFRFPDEAHDVQFCFTIPYLESNLRTWLASHAGSDRLRQETLCTSRQGRAVERLHAGCLDRPPAHRILLTARHHACESIANFVIEGFLDAVLAADDLGGWYARNAEVLTIPFVDKDGVENGDQGKNRRPHEHSRDYAGESAFPETAAIRKLLPAWSDGRCRLCIDLHCPWIRNFLNERIHQVGRKDLRTQEEQSRLGRLLLSCQTGPLRYDPADDIPFGTHWNTNPDRSKGLWGLCSTIPEIRLQTTFEIPYANHWETTMTVEGARAFGRDLARGARIFLEETARTSGART